MTAPTDKGMTQARLKKLFAYDEDSGEFRWRHSRKGVVAGRIAGSLENDGYLRITVDGEHFQAHHLAWLYVHGVWPADELDHENRVKRDNRIKNLRMIGTRKNRENTLKHRDNRSGFKGVTYHERTGTWVASIQANWQRKNLGYFKTPEEAADAYGRAAAQRHTCNPLAIQPSFENTMS